MASLLKSNRSWIPCGNTQNCPCYHCSILWNRLVDQKLWTSEIHFMLEEEGLVLAIYRMGFRIFFLQSITIIQIGNLFVLLFSWTETGKLWSPLISKRRLQTSCGLSLPPHGYGLFDLVILPWILGFCTAHAGGVQAVNSLRWNVENIQLSLLPQCSLKKFLSAFFYTSGSVRENQGSHWSKAT